MREVSGSTWTFQIIIIFIFIFACFLSLVITYSKAYTIKNRLLTVVEKYDGVTKEAMGVMNMYASDNGYKTKGKCPNKLGETWYGVTELSTGEDNYEEAQVGKKYFYCYKENSKKDDKVSYDIHVFYRFNLPFLGEIMTYKIAGETQDFEPARDRLVGE